MSQSLISTLHSHRSRLAAVLAGGLLGSALRTSAATALPWEESGWPLATLIVNVTGAAALGWFLARRATRSRGPVWIVFWATGVLGSLTTFSALSLEVVLMLDSGRAGLAAAYAAASTLLGVAAAAGGDYLGKRSW